MKTLEVQYIKMKYCERCFKYKVDHPPEYVFHGINSEHLKCQGRVINPIIDKINPAIGKSFFHRRYEEYFPNPRIHLGPLKICSLGNPNYDSWLAFDIETLKENNPDINFVRYDSWCALAFHDLPEKERRAKEERLFVDKYTTQDTIEVIVGSLDTRLMSFALSSSDKAYQVLQELKRELRKDFEIARADDLVSIIRKSMMCDVECNCGF